MKNINILFIFVFIQFLLPSTTHAQIYSGSFSCNKSNGYCETVNNCSNEYDINVFHPFFSNGQTCEEFSYEACPDTQDHNCLKKEQINFQPPSTVDFFCEVNKIYCQPYTNKLVQCDSYGNSENIIQDCGAINATCQAGQNDQPASCTGQNFGCPNTCPNGCYTRTNTCKPENTEDNTTEGNTTTDSTGQLINFTDLLSAVPGFKFTNTTLSGIVGAAIPFIFSLAGIALLTFLIWGGFQYLTSAGDPKKTESAKNTLTWAIVGFIVIVVAFWLTQIMSYVFNLGGTFGQ